MRAFLSKLLLGKVTRNVQSKYNPIQKCLHNVRAIWNNDHQDDNGLEKIIRLILSSSQLLFPGIYIKYLADKRGAEYQDLALDFYILFKVVFPIFILINHLFYFNWIVFVLAYVMMETVLYIPTLIFASDSFSKPRSYKRSMLLLFFNYLEIVGAFAVFYSSGDFLNKPLNAWFDAIYFSIITSSSIGYGDFYPVTVIGKFLVCIQALLFLSFVVLFLNFFSTKIQTKGYFNPES
jgi:hypothetical protein